MSPAAPEDIIVLLPGITGSVLRRDGKDVWDASPKAVIGGVLSRGGSIRHLELAEDPPDVDDLKDGVTVGGVIQDAHVALGLWSIDGYTAVRTSVCRELGLTAGESFFEFAYDWRRDNRVAARRLQRESDAWLQAARDRGAKDPKLILVAHSMGGLVSRYFIECLGGWKFTRRLITFGTPYCGSLNAVNFLANGFHKGWGPFSVDLSEVLRSFTSVYQLLPTFPCVDAGDGDLRCIADTAVPHVDAAKAAAALAFHTEIADAVEANLGNDDYRERRYGLHPIVGIVQPTWQSARVDGDRVALQHSRRGKNLKGDGTVPRISAVPPEIKEEGATYSSERHAALQNAEHVLGQLIGVLTRPDDAAYRGGKAFGGIPLAVELEETYLESEPIHVCVQPEEEVAELLDVVVSDTDTKAEVRRQRLLRRPDGPLEAELPPLPSGVYRLSVDGAEAAEPVHDLFCVIPDQPPE